MTNNLFFYLMRRRIPYRVCSCTPQGRVTHLEARLLRQLVNREIHPIRCAGSCRQKAMKAMRIGDLCAEAGHFLWARQVWCLGISEICGKDYREWRDVWFNTRLVRLADVVAEEEALMLGHRADSLWRALGHPEMVGYAASVLCEYDWLWYEKYNYDRNGWADRCQPAFEALERQQAADSLFREGQSDWQPPCSQDFFGHFQDIAPVKEEFSWIYGDN